MTKYVVDTSVIMNQRVSKLIKEGFDPKRILYLSLDFFTSRKEMRNAVNYFLDTNREAKDLFIFLDEVTTIKDWKLELKYLWDSGVTKRAKIIATGKLGDIAKEAIINVSAIVKKYFLRKIQFS